MSPALPSQRGAELLAGGKALGEWILAGGQPERHQALLQTRLRWNAYWFEKHLAQSRRNLENLPLAADPIILVGLWRTGSTALHARLSAASGCTTPLTWQCFRPASFALMPAPRTDLTVTRPMDDGKVSTFSPQEDEFASLLLGEPSVYRSFIDPRRLGEATALLKSWQTPHSPADSAAALSARWEDFLRTLVQQRPGRLLLKSPNHTFRMPWLNTRFPKAQFI